MKTMIEAEGLCKSYKKVTALKDISLKIGSGEIFGLIGPDGAGKTTLFRILTTLSLADSGTASVCGLDVVRTIGKSVRKSAICRDISPSTKT